MFSPSLALQGSPSMRGGSPDAGRGLYRTEPLVSGSSYYDASARRRRRGFFVTGDAAAAELASRVFSMPVSHAPYSWSVVCHMSRWDL